MKFEQIVETNRGGHVPLPPLFTLYIRRLIRDDAQT